jgi:anti-sigma factor RsiW
MDKQLDLDAKLELLEHLDSCDTCWETLYQLSKDRDAGLFLYRPYKAERIPA